MKTLGSGTTMRWLRIGSMVAILALTLGACGRGRIGTGPPSGTWSIVTTPSTGDLCTVRGSSATNIWISGREVIRWDGHNWSRLPSPRLSFYRCGLWVDSESSVWLAGETQIAYHWNGTFWQDIQRHANRTINAMWGTGPSDVWVVGANGYSERYDGMGWIFTGLGHGSDTGTGLWGTGSDVWATVALYNGGMDPELGGVAHSPRRDPNELQYQTQGPLLAIWGTAGNDIWAVGKSSNVFHFDGAHWSASRSPVTSALRGVWASDRNAYWAVGDGGVILYYDGASWLWFPSPTTANLNSVWGAARNDVWAVGDNGVVLHFSD